MKNPTLRSPQRTSDRAAPRPQRHWDARAATNFIAGGAGGGLLLCAAALATAATVAPFAGLDVAASGTAILLALLLIAGGLTCVWFEIGRPWRALNVYRHVATSWMTREAMVALALFAGGGLAWLTRHPLLVLLAGLLGLAFTYSQARILAANPGIPAWRHPRSVPLMIATGLTEGAGLLAGLAALSAAPGSATNAPALALALLVLLAVRAALWQRYLAGLSADGAPEAALTILQSLDRPLMMLGHALPALLLVAALAGLPGRAGLLGLAGLLVAASGGFLKFTLVCRAAYTQGLALPHLPVRGRGPAGPAAKPGWKTLPD